MTLEKSTVRIIHAKKPADLFRRINPKTERLITYPEILRARVDAFSLILVQFETYRGDSGFYLPLLSDLVRKCPKAWSIWSERFTGSSHMVRADNAQGEDTMFFFHGNPFSDLKQLIKAMEGPLSDGGIRYSNDAIATIINGTSSASQMSYSRYQQLRGGNYPVREFRDHPVFKMAAGDERLQTEYSLALEHLDILTSFYCRGMQSGWLPGNMKKGYGRLIAAGLKGDAFYPPNNSTLWHSAIVVPLETENNAVI